MAGTTNTVPTPYDSIRRANLPGVNLPRVSMAGRASSAFISIV